MSLRVLALMTDAFGARGGLAQYNRDLILALSTSEQVAQVRVLPRTPGVDPIRLPANVTQDVAQPDRARYSAAAAGTLLGRDYDVILCGHIYMAPLASMLGAAFRVPVWLQVIGVDSWERPTPLRRRAVEQARLVTSISRYSRQRFLQWANVDPGRVRILSCTVNPRFRPGAGPSPLRARLGLGDARVVLTVSRLASTERYKGHDRVIRLMPRLLRAQPDLVYLIAGEGDDRGRLEELAEDLQLGDAVRFIGYVAHEELPDLYRAADVFVMPSSGEGFGIVFLEAMACGTPAVGGNGDASMDPLRDGLSGAAVDVHDEQALAQAILVALQGRAPPGATEPFHFERFEASVHALVDAVARGRWGVLS